MIDSSRHVPLRSMPWSASEASAAIEEIVADAAAHFHAERFWPSHPREDGRLPALGEQVRPSVSARNRGPDNVAERRFADLDRVKPSARTPRSRKPL